MAAYIPIASSVEKTYRSYTYDISDITATKGTFLTTADCIMECNGITLACSLVIDFGANIVHSFYVSADCSEFSGMTIVDVRRMMNNAVRAFGSVFGTRFPKNSTHEPETINGEFIVEAAF